MFWTGFIVGVIVGAIVGASFGVLILALMHASDDDRD